MAKKEIKAGDFKAPAFETLEQAQEFIEKYVSEQEATKAEMAAEIESQAKHIQSLEAKLEKAPVTPTVEVGDKTYVVNSGAYVDGKDYSIEELVSSPEVCLSILAIDGQKILTEEV